VANAARWQEKKIVRFVSESDEILAQGAQDLERWNLNPTEWKFDEKEVEHTPIFKLLVHFGKILKRIETGSE
jgi:hypothetical protein